MEGLFRSVPEEQPFAIRVDPTEQVIRKKLPNSRVTCEKTAVVGKKNSEDEGKKDTTVRGWWVRRAGGWQRTGWRGKKQGKGCWRTWPERSRASIHLSFSLSSSPTFFLRSASSSLPVTPFLRPRHILRCTRIPKTKTRATVKGRVGERNNFALPTAEVRN